MIVVLVTSGCLSVCEGRFENRSCARKGMGSQGVGFFRREFLYFNAVPCRPMPFLVHFRERWFMFFLFLCVNVVSINPRAKTFMLNSNPSQISTDHVFLNRSRSVFYERSAALPLYSPFNSYLEPTSVRIKPTSVRIRSNILLLLLLLLLLL